MTTDWLDWLPHWLEWIEPWLPWLTLASVFMALASMVIIPVLIVKMPADYFTYQKRLRSWTLGRVALYVFRNALALVFLVAGLIMLILPGQGLLTILIAVAISDVPGKYRLELFILNQPRVLRAMNWIRKRYNRQPLKVRSLDSLRRLKNRQNKRS